jgi:hypothetical protein
MKRREWGLRMVACVGLFQVASALAGDLTLLPASGVADTSAPKFDALSRNLDAAMHAPANNSAPATGTWQVPLSSGLDTPSGAQRDVGIVTVIPRPGSSSGGAGYQQVDQLGGGWDAATVNMPDWQARDYNARIEAEKAQRKSAIEARNTPAIKFNIPPRELPPVDPR